MVIRHTAVRSEPLGPNDPGQGVYERFRAEPDALLLAVVDGDRRPLGLVERNSFFLRIASEYGRALYARRPISLIMDADPLVVEGRRALSDFTADALSERASDLLRGFIIVEDGLYAGVGTALDLLRAANAENQRTAGELFALAQSLEEAKAAAERGKLFTDTVVENIPAMIYVRDVRDGRCVLVNRAAELTLGRPRSELLGKRSEEVFLREEAAAFTAQDEAVLRSGEVVEVEEEEVHRPDGEVRMLRTRKLAVADEAGHPRYVLGVSEDITERKRTQAQIERMAHYDALTDLSNRVLFRRQLDTALTAARRTGDPLAVLCLDLDHFKTVNDTLGHAAGDLLLRKVGERLHACVRAGDAVARLGGDEFAILQTQAGHADEARALAARVVEALAAPFELMGREVGIGASVGIALHPRHGDDADTLMKRADLALYRAKSDGRNGWKVFEPAMDTHLQERRALEFDLRRALAAGEFTLHYQPLYALAADRITGFEALLRWNHPERGLVPPADFIPVAEEIGLITPLGEWVLRTACAEAAGWADERKLAVNVSPVQFRSRGLVAAVTSALASSGLSPGRLELEITESVLLQDDQANLRVLHQLHELGCRIALDDFGTGYSSLSYLRAFPFDKVKIDRSFVRDLPEAEDAAAIVRAVTTLASSLGMTTTAEGVETSAQLETLRRLGCTEVQGYLIGRPAPADHLPTRRARAA